MKKRNFFWGFVLVLMAICLIAGQYDAFGEIGFWKILLSIFGGAMILDGLFNITVEGVVVGGVLLCFLWRDWLGLGSLSMGTVIVAAILLIIGLNIILHPFKMKIDAWKTRREMKKYNRQINSGNGAANGTYTEANGGNDGNFSSNPNFTGNQQGYDGSYVKLKRTFGGGIEYIRSNDFQKADIELNFSGLKVYFDDAVIQGNEAIVNVDINFSGLELFIPGEWAIEDQIQRFAGGTEINPRPQNMASTKLLRLTGNVAFGGVTVHYF